ncbi:MAG: TrbG/VirB9 family P-type conjugative transfer protein [Bdellovibrionaceae bacterium]|nr:TrbG/VirB9 family P-type conjugative transfer protein [Pseudobdellovibrionaceae bacterium]
MFSLFSLFSIITFFLLSWGFGIAEARVRTVEVKKDQIVTVRTALGVATIIQLPDRPTSLVVGDQTAFKVEYLDQAITIKPLHIGARSNLYIYTDYRRFNVQLVTAVEASADYVVYLESQTAKPVTKAKTSKDGWRAYKNFLRNESLTLETKWVSKSTDGSLLVEFEVRGSGNEKFRPEWLWLTQNGKPKPVQGIALSSQDLKAGRPIKGLLQILERDVNRNEALRIELRRKKASYLTIPSEVAWK